MNRGLLLDTHTLLWYSVAPARLPENVLRLIRSRRRTVHISAVSAWEMSIKSRLGKLPQAHNLLANYHLRLAQYGFRDLPLSSVHTLKDRELTSDHKDPFDRALVAQAICEDLAIVSSDPRIAAFADVTVVWG